jgi:Ca2+-binding EF-hand superfamily protein
MGNQAATNKQKTVNNKKRQSSIRSNEAISSAVLTRPVKTQTKTSLTEQDVEYLSKQTGESKADIKEIHELFLKSNPSGYLSKKEFVNLYTKLRPEEPEKLQKISNFIFRAFDVDQSGTIDFNEFVVRMNYFYIM